MLTSNRIGLGTAQWGLKYGVSNKVGRASDEDIKSILFDAGGVDRIIDTAVSYGVAEEILGNYNLQGLKYRIVTKTRPFKDRNLSTSESIAYVRSDLKESLSKLDVPQIYGLMVHSSSDLLGLRGQALWKEMVELRESGFVSKIGCSFYSPKEFFKLSEEFDFDIIQIPYNIYDQRYVISGMAEFAFSKKIEVHLRSIFFFFFLLINATSIQRVSNDLFKKQQAFEKISLDSGYDKLTLALMFALRGGFQERLIVGTELFSQWKNLKDIANQKIEFIDHFYSRLKALKTGNEEIINPSKWNY